MKRFSRLTWADVSEHRPVLYGFAALWIAALHMQYRVPQSSPVAFLSAFQDLGACGVEIFVLLTGAGLYRSLEHDPNVLHFYKKRFMRVFLPSVIVGLIHFGIQLDSLPHWLGYSLYFPYWLGVDTLWYVAFILTMYLLYPFIHRIQKTHPGALWLLLAVSLLGALAISEMSNDWADICTRGVSRIPVFLLGCILAPRLERGIEFPRWLAPAALGGFFAFLLLYNFTGFAFYFWRTLGYICLSVFIILLIVRLCKSCRLGAPGRFIYRCFAFCGGISLEIYLLFSRLHPFSAYLTAQSSGETGALKLDLFTLVLTILVGWLLSNMCKKLIQDFGRIAVPEHTEKEIVQK